MRETVAPNGAQTFVIARANFVLAAISAAIAVGLAASNLIHRSDFFLNDDFRTYLIPVFGEVSRLIRHGEFPFVTNRVWNGGAFLGEYLGGLKSRLPDLNCIQW